MVWTQSDKQKPAAVADGLPKVLRLAALPALILSLLSPPAAAAMADSSGDTVDFETGFILSGDKLDVSRFRRRGAVQPGMYRGDVLLNQIWRARTDIEYRMVSGSDAAQPCFDIGTLKQYGVDLRKVYADPAQPERKPMPADGRFCGRIGDYIPGATADFDNGSQSLSLTVPQLYVSRDARGYVDPSQWDDGSHALVLNYNSNAYRHSGGGRDQRLAYAGIQAALNLGSWHLVHTGSLTAGSHRHTGYQSSATYAQHDVPALKGQLQGGDVRTSGHLFASVGLRGARFYTDERMYPQSQQGFAPTVRGFAESYARVSVRQRGTVIYETAVAPGPFVIDDLYATGYGGDLELEITEADGRVRRLRVPFDAVPQLLRPGQSRWELGAGKIRQYGYKHVPFVAVGTYQRGISNLATAYGGLAIGTGYFSALGGAALNTPLGAFSLDVTSARTSVPGLRGRQGISTRLGFSKIIASTGTNFSMAAYRYSTPNFLGLDDYAGAYDAHRRGGDAWSLPRSRNHLSINVSQRLGSKAGQFHLNGIRRDYWNRRGRQVDFSAGYSGHWRSLSYNVSLQRTRDSSLGGVPFDPGSREAGSDLPSTPAPWLPASRRETAALVTLGFPLGQDKHSPSLSGQFSNSRLSGSASQAMLTGTLGEYNRYSYTATAGRFDGATTVGAYGQYAGSRTNLQVGYSYSNRYSQYSVGAGGAVVVHGGGVTFSQPTGATLGLIHAPDAAGASISGTQGLKVDRRGYAVVPNLLPYQNNIVTLDPKGIAANVDLKSTTVNVAPRALTVTRLHFETSVGRALLISARLPDGSPLPFSADVFDEAGGNVGVVGQSSRLFVQGVERSGVLTVRWGRGAAERCRIPVELAAPAQRLQDEYERLSGTCVPDTQLADD